MEKKDQIQSRGYINPSKELKRGEEEGRRKPEELNLKSHPLRLDALLTKFVLYHILISSFLLVFVMLFIRQSATLQTHLTTTPNVCL